MTAIASENQPKFRTPFELTISDKNFCYNSTNFNVYLVISCEIYISKVTWPAGIWGQSPYSKASTIALQAVSYHMPPLTNEDAGMKDRDK